MDRSWSPLILWIVPEQNTKNTPDPDRAREERRAAQLTVAMRLIQEELAHLIGQVQTSELAGLCAAIQEARRVFVAGAGRSGLALRMFAMRLMHLGLTVHVAGEVTAPALAEGDLLIIASASGTTAGMLHAAETAAKVHARMFAITAAPESPLAKKATGVLVLPAASKQDVGARSSQQYAGSLFEQAVLVVLDAAFHALWQQSQQTAEGLLRRHANLE